MNTTHPQLGEWIDEWTALLQPDAVEWTEATLPGWKVEIGRREGAQLPKSDDSLAELLRVDAESWRLELAQIEAHYESLGDRLPVELADELRDLDKRLSGWPG